MKLSQAPNHIEMFKEIAILYNAELADFYNDLKPDERVVAYYLFRASLPGNTILTDQLHCHAQAIQKIFYELICMEHDILSLEDNNHDVAKKVSLQKFVQEVQCYSVYVWTNHSQYFATECFNEKRTPGRLRLQTLTKENMITISKALGREDIVALIEEVNESLFDKTYQPTLTVPNSIEESAVNIYAPGFSEQDYEQLSLEAREKLNAYFDIESSNGQRKPRMLVYSQQGKYKKEISVIVFWLAKALEHAMLHQSLFDVHLVKGLEFLIEFFKTGDEAFFKKHSIEWLQSTSRIDYCMGFIETYRDPKAKRGFFQGEVTIKKHDLKEFNKILTDIEENLPFAEDFKRHPRSIKPQPILNASMNIKMFGSGELGPLNITAAYCLPNYEDIRVNHGSKQIIYPGVRGLHALLNPSLAHKLFFLREDADWLEEHDPEWNFFNELWTVQCLLHETIGHGSGKLSIHTFKEKECLLCGHKKYTLGESIPVSQENISDLLKGYEHVIEELRAEIIALYVSVIHLDDLLEQGFLTTWYKRIGKTELIKWIIFYMVHAGLMRLVQQNDEATQVTGDHALANCTITNYLAETGGIEIVEETIREDGKDIPVVGINVVNVKKAVQNITKLMQDVQRIKSTGDGLEAQKLIETYGRPLPAKHFKILKDNDKLITGNLKVYAYLFPLFTPNKDAAGQIVDIAARWPKNIFEQYKAYKALELSME